MTPAVDQVVGIARLATILGAAQRILIFTGAGISTASGIPDYRGPKGVWNTRRPVFYDDFMASRESRVEYWRQKAEDREAFRSARPNPVHEAVVALERAGRLELLVTQNVDGLHRIAGTSEDRLVEIHGTNGRVECQTCSVRTDPSGPFEEFEASGEPPVCECGGFLKPATISFGQALRMEDLTRSCEAANRADAALALGSTLLVTPAADIPLEAARTGSCYAIINRGPTEHDDSPFVTLRVDGDVGAIFPAAVAQALA